MSDNTSATGLVNVSANASFRTEIERRGGEHLSRCLQCLKCGTGCPVAFAMDHNPAQIIRMAVLGMKDEVLKSKTIWLCSDCKTCTTRCPMEIDVSGVMDILKEMAVEDGVACPEGNTKTFHDVFMGIVCARGKVNEPLLLGHYKMRTGTYTQDMESGKQMILKGKIKYSGKSTSHGEVKKIIDKYRKNK